MTRACSAAVSVFMYTRLAEKCRSVNVLFLTWPCVSVRISGVKVLIYPVLHMWVVYTRELRWDSRAVIVRYDERGACVELRNVVAQDYSTQGYE